MFMKFTIKTLGCKVNQYESEYLINSLIEKGLQYVNLEESPDFIIINSCTVTDEAKRQSLQILRKAKRINPSSKIILTGCVVDENNRLSEDIIIVSNSLKAKIPEILLNYNTKKLYIKNIFNVDKFLELKVKNFHNTTRAFLKIQEGCNNYCSYCIIPYVRGKPRSLEKEKVINSILELSKNYKEIVLCGINIELYGLDFGEKNGLYNLLNEIDNELNKKNIKDLRIRLTSLKPDKIHEDLIKLIIKSKYFCNHFHLSIQNFNDEVLKLMNRNYGYREIEECVATIKSYDEYSNIGADVITGFINETEERFMDNVEKMKKIDINYFHIFPFSLKKGTKAENFKESIDKKEKKRRVKILKEIANSKKIDFLKKNLKKTHRVLIEKKEDNYFTGYSDNYLKFYLKIDLNQLKNEFINVIPEEVYKDGLKGGVNL